MRTDIKRGYEILPNNNVRFGVRVTNSSDSVISDVQVILDYNESLFNLRGKGIQKLGNIPPAASRTAKFILKPLGCVHEENVEATISYRDHKWEKHIETMRPKEVHCVCPSLSLRPMKKSEFLSLSEKGYSAEAGINFQGISAERITSFLMQTCATRLYVVDGHSTGEDSVIYFSGEAASEKTYYLLTVLVKEKDDMTQVMLRAVSDKSYGINGFLNEIVSELRHLADTVSSAREIGIIKHEQAINIIDSVVQRSNITNGTDPASISIKDSVVQRMGINVSRPTPSNDDDDIVIRSRTPIPENIDEDDDDISDMYNMYLE
ncbi:MAG: hypothetical protein MJB12_11690, partial [Firmicutes bacterium]|nr:hypothetical protein [Bacillota bacterium]